MDGLTMYIEFEATFIKINKDNIRLRLKKAGAKLVRKEFYKNE